MAIVGISITKRVAFRDATQEFSNVYFYRVIPLPSEAEAIARINEVANAEKGFHSTAVTFVKGRLWSAGGLPNANNMIAQVSLTGTGSGTSDPGLDRERAYLFMWPAGVDSRGKPVFLRKWYHTCGPIAGAPLDGPKISGTTGFTQAQRDAAEAIINPLRVIGSGQYLLTAESGRDSQGDAIMHRYLEHHQLGDQWRAQ